MKKLILILTLLTALFLAGCTGPSYEGDQCYDNSVCSIKEQYIGGCADCVPDLEVQQDNFYVNLNDDTLEANVCVKNLHGEYKGNIATSWCVSDNNHGDCNWEEENAYFESQEVQGDLNIDVGPGKLNAWSNLQIGDQEEWACFYHEFNVAPSSDYYVYFDINNDQKVKEQNYDNNQAFKHIEGNLDLSEYLIGQDIGDFNFNDWYMNNDDVDFNGNEYKFNTYYANYENDNSGVESKVLVAAEFTQGNAENAFYDLLTMIEEDSNENYSETTIGDGNVYVFPSENEILWLSEGKFVMIKSEDSPTTDVSLAYMEKHPSVLEGVNPIPIDGIPLFDGVNGEYPMPGDSIGEVVEVLTEDDSNLLDSNSITNGSDDIDYEQKILIGGAEFLYDSDYEEYVIQSEDGQTSKFYYAYNIEFEDTFYPNSFEGETMEFFGKNHYVLNGNDNRLVLFQSDMHTFLGLNNGIELTYEGEEYFIELIAVNDQTNPYKATIKINGNFKTFDEGDVKTVGGLEAVYMKDIIITSINGTDIGSVNLAFGKELVFENNEMVEKEGDDLPETYVDMPINNGGIDYLTVFVSMKDDNDGPLLQGESAEDSCFNSFSLLYNEVTANEGLKSWIIENP